MRAGATVFIILGVPAMIALPALGHAQGPTVGRGLLRGTLSSPDAATGLLRGSMPQGTGGLTRGSLPSGGTAGLLQATPPGAKVGLLLDTTRNATVPVLPAGMSPAPYALVRGSVSSVPGALLASPVPADARFGEPGPRDLAGTLESQSQLYLVDGNGRVLALVPEPSSFALMIAGVVSLLWLARRRSLLLRRLV
jgi:hypothetical protein